MAAMGGDTRIRFVLNGRAVTAEGPSHLTVLQYLRAQGLCGTKEGCAEGECGACAVAMLTSEPGEAGSHFEPVNSCLLPLGAVEGRELTTVEGIAEVDGLHPVQSAMVAAGGSQCGYCTPGFVVSLFCEYYRPGRTRFDPESISGNLCRCTGYRPIADVARALPAPSPAEPRSVQLRTRAAALTASESGSPSERFFRPSTLGEALALLDAHPSAQPIAGGTDLIVYANQRYQRFPVLVSVEALPELHQLTFGDSELVLGAAVPLSRIERALHLEPSVPLLAQLLPLFSSRLIRNRATLGGNLGTASPIGDSAPALLALGAELELVSARGTRRLPLAEFFLGYRRTALAPGELIVTVRIPRPTPSFQRFYKVSKRVLDDISTVAAGFALSLDAQGRVTRFGVGLGGVAATPLCATSLERIALGLPWNESTLGLLLAEAVRIGTPQSDLRGSAEYRRALLGKLIEKFFYESRQAEAAE
ncbi:MAG TPA: FAD binding domain-containing protein [Polyangiaceae bacterium]|nr:FAD binding domain-containing protein [Polyangiaceae bacterium]